MAKIEGGCSCGKVRYSGEAEPIFQGVCHCKNCQKGSGSAFNAVVAIPSAALTVTGAVKQYDSTGDSGQGTHKTFCPNCGSPLTDWVDIMPDVIMIPVGTLDDPSWFKPGMQIYCDSELSWAHLGKGLQSFAKMPGPG